MSFIAEASVLFAGCLAVCTIAFWLLVRHAPVVPCPRCSRPGCGSPRNGRLLLCDAHEDVRLDIADATRGDR